MSKKKFTATDGIIFSTDPNFKPATSSEPEDETLIPAQQKIRIRLDTKHRAGKAVTLAEGFVGKRKTLKTSVKRSRHSAVPAAQ